MRKHIKKIIYIVSAFVFAFCPVLLVGCDCSGIGNGGGGGNGGDTPVTPVTPTTPTYKVTDYLSGLKTAYTPAVDSSPDEALNQYADEVLGLTEILAVDTFVNLMENYFKPNTDNSEGEDNNEYFKGHTSSDKSISIAFEETNYIALNKIVNVTYNSDTYRTYTQVTNNDGTISYFKFNDSVMTGTETGKKYKWILKLDDDPNFNANDTSITNLINYFLSNNDASDTISKDATAYKMMYAILYISNNFYNVTSDGFDKAYSAFKNHYDKIDDTFDWETECRKLALSSKHSGLIADSTEEKAFKQYILDFIIGETNVERDNEMVSTYSNGSYKQGGVFEGEYYLYYNYGTDTRKDIVDLKDDIGTYSYIDLIEIIANNNDGKIDGLEVISGFIVQYKDQQYNISMEQNKSDLLSAINEDRIKDGEEEITPDELTEIIEKNNYIINGLTFKNNGNGKLWQDFNQDGKADVVWATDSSGNELKDASGNKIPKYRVENPEFRNYDWTVGQIVNKVISNSEIKYQADGSETGTTITGYPTVSNVFSRDYTYSDVEVDSGDLNAKYTCSLPRNAYKSILICATALTGKDYPNNIGYINMVLESAENVSVNVKIFARYYRTGVGYATWDNGVELDGEKTLFPLVTDSRGNIATQKINGPYKVELVNGKIQDSSLEINVQEMFKKAKFNGVTNDKKFNFSYTDADAVEQSKLIYQIEPFASGYCNTSVKKSVHASVFTQNGKTNPTYSSFTLPTGEIIYSYDASNLQGVGEGYGYIEILFAPSNENAFTFGLLGYVPETEFSI